MKILAANKYYFLFGGSERYYFELNRLHEESGHEVIPFAMKHPENFPSKYDKYFIKEVNYWNDPNITEKLRAAGRILYSTEANRNIERLLAETKPDIAHLHLIYHQLPPTFLPRIRDFGIPIVHTLHDYKPICPSYSLVANDEICERCKGNRFFQATIQRCNHDSLVASFLNTVEMYLHHGIGYYDIPDIFITPSNFMRDKLIEFGMPSEKLVHIPNFIDTSYPIPKVTRKKQFLYVGRLVSIKGLITLIEAVRRVNLGEHTLLIVGEGPQEKYLKDLVQEYQLANVKFMGYQPKENVYRFLAESQFSVLPSIVYENCPLSVLESMAVGTPVIGSKLGGIPELIDDQKDGLLFQPKSATDLAEKIEFMITNPAQVLQMGEIAQQKVFSKYNSEIHHRRILDIYHQLIH